MLNTLTLATRGRLGGGRRRTLTLATMGRLQAAALAYILYKYSGSEWVKAQLKKYSGGEFLDANLKIWNGSEWITVDVNG